MTALGPPLHYIIFVCAGHLPKYKSDLKCAAYSCCRVARTTQIGERDQYLHLIGSWHVTNNFSCSLLFLWLLAVWVLCIFLPKGSNTNGNSSHYTYKNYCSPGIARPGIVDNSLFWFHSLAWKHVFFSMIYWLINALGHIYFISLSGRKRYELIISLSQKQGRAVLFKGHWTTKAKLSKQSHINNSRYLWKASRHLEA